MTESPHDAYSSYIRKAKAAEGALDYEEAKACAAIAATAATMAVILRWVHHGLSEVRVAHGATYNQ